MSACTVLCGAGGPLLLVPVCTGPACQDAEVYHKNAFGRCKGQARKPKESKTANYRYHTFLIFSASDGPRLAPQVGLLAGVPPLPGPPRPAPFSLAAVSNIFKRSDKDINVHLHTQSEHRLLRSQHLRASKSLPLLGLALLLCLQLPSSPPSTPQSAQRM